MTPAPDRSRLAVPTLSNGFSVPLTGSGPSGPWYLDRPVVGTAWDLGGLAISLSKIVFGIAPSFLRAELHLGLGGLIDTFDLWTPRYTTTELRSDVVHSYQPSYTIFDMSALSLLFRTDGSNFSFDVRAVGNIAYL